jgi:hypothetical protein
MNLFQFTGSFDSEVLGGLKIDWPLMFRITGLWSEVI